MRQTLLAAPNVPVNGTEKKVKITLAMLMVTMHYRRMGRNKLPTKIARRQRRVVLFTKDEARIAKANARSAGKTFSEFARGLILQTV